MGINEYNAAFSPNGINGFASVLGRAITRGLPRAGKLVGEKRILVWGSIIIRVMGLGKIMIGIIW